MGWKSFFWGGGGGGGTTAHDMGGSLHTADTLANLLRDEMAAEMADWPGVKDRR